MTSGGEGCEEDETKGYGSDHLCGQLDWVGRFDQVGMLRGRGGECKFENDDRTDASFVLFGLIGDAASLGAINYQEKSSEVTPMVERCATLKMSRLI
jgi:hypothetical protein